MAKEDWIEFKIEKNKKYTLLEVVDFIFSAHDLKYIVERTGYNLQTVRNLQTLFRSGGISQKSMFNMVRRFDMFETLVPKQKPTLFKLKK